MSDVGDKFDEGDDGTFMFGLVEEDDVDGTEDNASSFITFPSSFPNEDDCVD